MGTVLEFTSAHRVRRWSRPRRNCENAPRGEVVVFPGVRIERHTLDLSVRIGRNTDKTVLAGQERDPGFSF
ncbi:hypothetical protein H2509_18095 [Stappia sp. F7233]|uniref:Uncharacterized protein n=1 Tax=Stappia albiluteola TaxID=2758565 RepID=A0A839AJB9_9HYPH|nr:hypothetical protein [Stappia albiluteola]MBA5779044.1 hypothetical protein [Stappia albiluteola]